MQKTNKVVRISYSGGLLGSTFGSARGQLEKVLEQHNKDGWNLAEVIPDNPNLVIWAIRVIILILTLGLWTFSSSYLLILERPTNLQVDTKKNYKQLSSDSAAPVLTARRI